ncbi:hypothetical protein QVZ41_01815 [Wenyingzhuangia sp. chi5]|uniref:Uncharacterized protein n=1 Tax=Wenyingzhuangia gilva TaxID=3057677 RepID=A0ABT8VNN0_9FLAO|nr:hypothetical protein [Wenyingzhuangia sp. chi5]MDO3693584.1 hypothetical protein [Wenyingzhuangia sp. chi5]
MDTSKKESNFEGELALSVFKVSHYYDVFTRVVEFASEKKILKAKSCISKIAELKSEMHALQDLKEKCEIPTRVIFTDKIQPFEGFCCEFGDAVRKLCNTADDDEKDISKVEFNMSFYKSYKESLLTKIDGGLTLFEKQYLAQSVKIMMFVTGLNFLIDYLNNDLNYKSTYKGQNLIKAKNQFKLIDSFVSQMNKNEIIKNECFV